MSVTPSQAVAIRFTVEGIDGQLVAPDALPTAVLYRNADATAVVVTVVSSATGKYSASWTNAAYSENDQLTIEVTAVITGDTYVANVWSDTVLTTPATPDQIMGGLVTGSQPAGSLARFVRDIKSNDLLFEGQIVSATTDKAILDAGATTVCVGQAISIGAEGDAERQTRFITAFDPATKEITLDRQWCVVPSNGADYQIKTHRNPLVGDRTKVLSGGFNEAITDTFNVLDTLTEDSSGLRYTAKALEQAPAGGGGGGGATAEDIVDEFENRGITTVAVQQGVTNATTLELIQGDTYDGTGKPLLGFVVTKDYTSGWTATLTIRDEDDAVISTTTGVVASATSITFSLTAPTGLPMSGCPGSFKGKFDVQMSNGSSRDTVTRGACYVYEDQTRT